MLSVSEVQQDADDLLISGNSFFSMRLYERAIEEYDEAIRLNPSDWTAYQNKGKALARQGKHEDAIDYLGKAISLNENNSDTWNDKGTSLLELRRLDEAIGCYQRALEIDRGYAWGWGNKAKVLLELRNYMEAITHFEAGIKLRPDTTDAADWTYSIGMAYEKLGDLDRATSSYRRAVDLCDTVLSVSAGDVVALMTKGDALVSLGSYDLALPCFLEALRLEPKNFATLTRLGNLYSDYLYDHKAAASYLRRALAIDRTSFVGLANYAEVLAKLGNYRVGKRYAKRAVDAAEDATDECVGWLLLACCDLLPNKLRSSANLDNFLECYRNQEAISKGWIFTGLIDAVKKQSANLQTTFVLLTAIDMLEGRINKDSLSFIKTPQP